MSRTIVVEWRHIASETGATCDRCMATGEALHAAVAGLGPFLEMKGVRVEVQETLLPVRELAESNAVLIDGVPIERWLGGAKVVETDCPSCASLAETPQACCRALVTDTGVYEALTPGLIAAALLKASGVEEGDQP